jgi:hypothetical protein
MRSIAREALRFNKSKMSISVSSLGNPPLFPSLPYSLASDAKIGRNELCHCGSGKKYKRCCGKADY